MILFCLMVCPGRPRHVTAGFQSAIGCELNWLQNYLSGPERSSVPAFVPGGTLAGKGDALPFRR